MTRDFDLLDDKIKGSDDKDKVTGWRPKDWFNPYQNDTTNRIVDWQAFEEGADAMLGPAFCLGMSKAADYLARLARRVDVNNWPLILNGHVIHSKKLGK